MKMPFFASFIVFIILVSYEIAKSRRTTAEKESSFWEKENRANSTRRKSLDDLNYIRVPLEDLPMDTMADDETVSECHQTMHHLAQSPIVNFTGISNTDLKLRYGAPNIELLMGYDQNYTTLVRTLQKWAEKLHEAGHTAQAKQVLEFAVSTDTDVSNTYKLLAAIYAAEGSYGEIARLKERAGNLNSASKNIIVRMLQKFDS